MRKFLVGIVPAVLLSISPAAIAAGGGCNIVRDVSISDPQISFQSYRDSESACGVTDQALPYILKADGSEPKGTIVLVHGLKANPEVMLQMAKIFQKQGYNVVAPILKGHGGSEELLATQSNVNQWEADVKYAGDIAGRLTRPIFLVGHSTGGALATVEAGRAPGKYNGIVELDPALNIDNVANRNLICPFRSVGLEYENQIPNFLTHADYARNDDRFMQNMYDILNANVKKYCEDNMEIPPFDHHVTMAGGCALYKTTRDVEQQNPKTQPPTFLLLSKDADLYEKKIDRASVVKFVDQIPDHEVYQTQAPNHGLMPAKCSPDYDVYMKKIGAWLEAHRGPSGGGAESTNPGDAVR